MVEGTGVSVTIALGIRIVLIVAAGLAGYLALRMAVGLGVRGVIDRRRREIGPGGASPLELERRVRTIGTLVVRVAGGIIVVVAVLMILDVFGIDIGPAVAGLGVAGIAVGFGAQTLVRDWLAGVFVVLENQYNQGDLVRIAGVEGTVEEISLRRTLLRDAEGAVHTVPNGQILVSSRLASHPEPADAAADDEGDDEGVDAAPAGEPT